jgi:hypothetical protein
MAFIDRIVKDPGVQDAIQEILMNDGDTVLSIDALGREDDPLEIEIVESANVFWIRVNEFDDTGYFDSWKSAEAYARMEYESLISAYEEKLLEEDKDEEEDDRALPDR